MGKIGDAVLSLLGGFAPVKLITWGYLLFILVSWALLTLPLAHEGAAPTSLDVLFTAASALSTTGLSTVNTAATYSAFGEVLILVFLQIGGIGYMTVASFVVLAQHKPLSALQQGMIRSEFAMPRGFELYEFVRGVVLYTFIAELIGALCLAFLFWQEGVDGFMWKAIFHSVSAFCTSGLHLFENSFVDFTTNFWINAVLAILSYLGAIGFIVAVDVWRRLRGKAERLSLTSRIIVRLTLLIAVISLVLVYLTDPSIENLRPDQRLVTSFFHVMSAMTTVGFYSLPVDTFAVSAVFVLLVLMIIGASPSGTGGGIKTTTVAALYASMRSNLRQRASITFWGRELPSNQVQAATTSFSFYVIVLASAVYLLLVTEEATYLSTMFEAASALSTVGLSLGLTPELTNLGKLIIIVLMFIGRLGPLTFGYAIFAGEEDEAAAPEDSTEKNTTATESEQPRTGGSKRDGRADQKVEELPDETAERDDEEEEGGGVVIE